MIRIWELQTLLAWGDHAASHADYQQMVILDLFDTPTSDIKALVADGKGTELV
jgi:hypothetical protein